MALGYYAERGRRASDAANPNTNTATTN
jgi:hypothetical protein